MIRSCVECGDDPAARVFMPQPPMRGGLPMSPLARIRRIPAGLHGLWIVRVYDGFDNCWYDCTKPVPYAEAMVKWNRETKHGTEKVGYSSGGSYYRVFRADMVMLHRPETAFPPGSGR